MKPRDNVFFARLIRLIFFGFSKISRDDHRLVTKQRTGQVSTGHQPIFARCVIDQHII